MGRLPKEYPFLKDWAHLVYAMLARLLLLAAILLVLAALDSFRTRGIAQYIFVAACFATTIPYAFWLRREETTRRSAVYQFVVDVLIITGLIHFTGGINSQLNVLYPLVIIAAGVVVSGHLAVRIAMLSMFLYTTVILLETGGVLEHQGDWGPYVSAAKTVQTLGLRILIFALFTAAISYLADRCFYADRQMERLRMIANSIVDNVNIPLMAVYGDGQILLANPAAQRMLEAEAPELTKHRFQDFFEGTAPDLTDVQSDHQIWWMQKGDGSTFPVTFEASHDSFPAIVVDSLADRDQNVQLYLVALHDMTEILAQQNRAGTESGNQVAADMITEMVHVVRNPLTAIKGAGQLLDAAVDDMFRNTGQMTEEDWQSIKAMCRIIYDQTQQLDEKVRELLACAAEEPDKLTERFPEANKWRLRI